MPHRRMLHRLGCLSLVGAGWAAGDLLDAIPTLSGVSLGLGPAPVWAQAEDDYQRWPQFDGDFRREEQAKNNLLRGESPNAAELGRFYRQVLLPRLTDPSRLDEANEVRDKILIDLTMAGQRSSGTGRAGDPYTAVIQALYPPLRELAEGQFHPTTRIAAIRLIGNLDRVPATRTTPPEPSFQVADFLRGIAVGAEEGDAIRFAALASLQRQVGYGRFFWTAEQLSGMAEQLLVLLQSSRPGGRPPEVHAWMQRRCIDMLLDCYELGSSRDAIRRALVQATIADATSESVRGYLLERLTRLGPDAYSADQAASMAAYLAAWTKREIDLWLIDLREANARGGSSYGGFGGGGLGGGGMLGGPGGLGDMGGGDLGMGGLDGFGGGRGRDRDRRPAAKNLTETQDPQTRLMRRRLHLVLQTAHVALDQTTHASAQRTDAANGLVRRLAQGEQRQAAQEFLQVVQDLQRDLNDEEITDIQSLRRKVFGTIEELQKMLAAFPGAEALNQADDVAGEAQAILAGGEQLFDQEGGDPQAGAVGGDPADGPPDGGPQDGGPQDGEQPGDG